MGSTGSRGPLECNSNVQNKNSRKSKIKIKNKNEGQDKKQTKRLREMMGREQRLHSVVNAPPELPQNRPTQNQKPKTKDDNTRQARSPSPKGKQKEKGQKNLQKEKHQIGTLEELYNSTVALTMVLFRNLNLSVPSRCSWCSNLRSSGL